jgi:hypothetical protein
MNRSITVWDTAVDLVLTALKFDILMLYCLLVCYSLSVLRIYS